MAQQGQHERSRLGPLVGRARELDEVEAALDRLADGEPWMLQLAGEPGIGKSRLLGELGIRALRRDYLVLDGRAAEFERDVPFGLILDALNDYLGSLEATFLRSLDDATVVELSSIFPALASLGGGAPAKPLAGDRYRTQYAIRALLERLALRQPLVLLLDDVHWADAASIDVIAHLSRRFRGPLLAAFAFRRPPVRLASALHIAARAGFGSQLELSALTRDEAETLIGRTPDPAIRAALYSESGGNPFYLEQLARATDPARPHDSLALEHPRVEGRLPAAVAAAIRGEVGMLGGRPESCWTPRRSPGSRSSLNL